MPAKKETPDYCFRARFRQPKRGPLNKSGFKVPGEIQIEVYPQSASRWEARIIPSLAPERAFGSVAFPASLRQAVEDQFEEMVVEWQAFRMSNRQPIDWPANEEQPEVRLTHATDKTREPGRYTLRALCGAQVNVAAITDTESQVTCSNCQKKLRSRP